MSTPRSCLVLGSGRSGTSMVAGTLAAAGYHMGDGLYLPRTANPKGFFEAPEINAINEELLAEQLRLVPRLEAGQRWLGIPRRDARFDPPQATDELGRRITAVLARHPFCLKDPRLSFTLPAWRPFLPADTGHVCVFRHPLLTAKSILEECRSARYLRSADVDQAYAIELWAAMYRTILEEHRSQGAWHFVHYDQALTEDGLAGLEAFLGTRVDRRFPDRALKRTPADDDLPAELKDVYAELCELAGHRAKDTTSVTVAAPTDEPRVSVVALIASGHEELVPRIVADVQAQRGVRTELILVDTRSPIVDEHGLSPAQREQAARPLELPEGAEHVRMVRSCDHSRGRAYLDALEHVTSDTVALLAPECRPLQTWLARSVAQLTESGTDLVTCDYYLSDDDGQFVDRVHPAGMGEAPGPYWHGGVLLTRGTLATIPTTSFRLAELELYQGLRNAERIAHVTEPGFHLARAAYQAAWERSRHDAALLALQAREPLAEPELTISLCTYNRAGVLVECLEALSRQVLPLGTFEIVIVDDGSTDATGEVLDALELPVPFQRVRRENGGLAAARNTGLELARGRLVLFINDDTIAFPDMVSQHLRAHRRLVDEGLVAVLGTFEQPPEALDNALMAYLESSNEVFGYADLTDGQFYDGLRFYTCNVSVPTEDVRAIGGFDTSYRHYGCEDTDLAIRLEERGLRVHYCAAARANHRHFMDFEGLQRRQRMVAHAFVRFFQKHPAVLERWKAQGQTLAECRRFVAVQEPHLETLEGAARELARINVGAMRRLGGDLAGAADALQAQLGRLVRGLHRVWWQQGYVDGFVEFGLEGFPEVWEAHVLAQANRAGSVPPVRPQPARRATRTPSTPELSVIVPTHDRARELRQLVEALRQQDLEPERFEVLVVDDGSQVPATEVLANVDTPFPLHVLRQENAGPACARNRALEHAQGETVVFLNDDAVPHRENLRRHLENHLWASEPRAVLGTFQLLPSLVRDSFTHLVQTTDLFFAQPLMKAGVFYHGLAFCTGNVSLPRTALDAVGRFDTSFPFAGAEDSELGLRLERRLGMRVLFDPLVDCAHDHDLTVDAYARRQRILGWSVFKMAQLHADASIVTGDPARALDEAFWNELQSGIEERSETNDAHRQAVAELCRRERAGGQPPQAMHHVEPLVRAVGEHEFQLGLLLGAAGIAPSELFAARSAAACA